MSTTATATELWRLGAGELAAAIRMKKASSREVVEAHLARIDAVNPVVNAVTVLLREQALDAADAADRALAAGGALGPLHGVPFTVKQNIDLTGAATTIGLKMLAEAFPAVDAPIVARMRAAGAIPLGHTNCPSMAVRWHTDSELWGATMNPWDPSRTPGASSGGEAVAVATGISPLGLGNDGLGSLRWPAQCCGVAALKPTLGRIPYATAIPGPGEPIGPQLVAVQGPIARHVADLRTALEILAGPTWRDPWSVPAPVRGPALREPVHVALVVDPGGHGTAAQVRDGVRKAAETLASAGYVVDEVEPPSIDLAAKTLLDMLNTPEFRAGYDTFMAAMPADTQRFFAAFYEVAGPCDPVDSVASFITRYELLRAWGEFQETQPLIVGPISTDIPFRAGSDLADGAVAATIHDMRLTLAINALGLPAVALPVGIRDGLPQVVQIIGPRYREDLCLDAAAAMEDRLGVITPIDPRF
ncbi:MAG TPA: amidase [Euzebyales bacterium]|nr:amidase [Euzebyales bacterium]